MSSRSSRDAALSDAHSSAVSSAGEMGKLNLHHRDYHAARGQER
jgi:hypothetical protein